MQNYLDDLKGWLKHPYNEEGSALQWFLFIGLWVVCTYLWVKVIHDLAD